VEGTIKTDCFAYECEGCNALRSLVCKNSNCNFYKSKLDFIKQIDEMYGITDMAKYFKLIMKEGNHSERNVY
jgi:hypothetical protein